MPTNNSPLENLTAFAIAFVAGALSAVSLQLYGSWVKRQVVKEIKSE